MRLIPNSVIAKIKEVITASDAPHKEKEMIRLICKQKKKLLVPRSLLIQSSAYFAAILSSESGWEESLRRTIELAAWPRNDLAVILRSLETKNMKQIFKNMNHYFPAIHYFFITPLMEECINFKIRNIQRCHVHKESVIDDLELAERFSIVELRDECMSYLLEKLPKMLRTSRRKMTAELLRKLLRHQSMIVHNSSVTYDKELFILRRHKDPFRRNHRVQCFTGFQDFWDPELMSTIPFPCFYAVAPPVAFNDDLFLVYMPCEKQPTFSRGCYAVKYGNFTSMKIIRFQNGMSTSRQLQVSPEYDPEPPSDLEPNPNKLFVSDKWTILLLPNRGVLIVIDSPHPVGPIIEIPEKYWKIEDPDFIKSRTVSDLVIVGNVAYVLMKFHVSGSIWQRTNDRRWSVRKDWPAGSLTTYDLTEGKWLPDHSVDLETIYSDRRIFGADNDDLLQFSLKVVQNEVFLIVKGTRVEARKSGFSLADFNYTYRLERPAEGLCLTLASAAIADGPLKPLKYTYLYSTGILSAWRGRTVRLVNFRPIPVKRKIPLNARSYVA